MEKQIMSNSCRIARRTAWCAALPLPLALIATATIFAGAVRPQSQPQAVGSGYHVVRKIPVPGSDGWDYLGIDSDTGRFFISRGTHVQVLDDAAGTIVGDIPDTQGVHGI